MIADIYAGIGSALKADSTIISELGGTRIYAEMAAENAPMPYIVMQFMGGGDENVYAQQAADVVISVQCVGTVSPAVIRVASRIRTVLHENHGSVNLGTAWSAYRVQHRSAVSFTELVERVKYYYSGGTYRVRATKT